MGQAPTLWEYRDRPILHCPKWVVPPQTAAELSDILGLTQPCCREHAEHAGLLLGEDLQDMVQERKIHSTPSPKADAWV